MNTDVTLTTRALDEALHLLATVEEYKGMALRLYLEGKGCDGFFYGVSFDKAQGNDLKVNVHAELQVVVDPETLTFVKGSSIDFIDDERGRGFLVSNPHHRRFRGKFYKKKEWQDRLSGKELS